MRRYASVLAVVPLALFAVGCARSMVVRGAEPGRVELLQNQPVDEIYFQSFDHSEAELAGDHRDASVNKPKWFPFLLAGASEAAQDAGVRVVVVGLRPRLMSAIELKVGPRPLEATINPPKDAVMVRGRYVYSQEVSGTARAMAGMLNGASWTRAEVTISRGDEVVYQCHIDGEYLGSAYSWGYETLSANEEIGRAIVELVGALQKGERIRSQPLTEP